MFCCSLLFILPLALSIVAIVQMSSGKNASAKKMTKIATITAGAMLGLGILLWVAYIVFVVVLGTTQQPSYSY